MRTNFRITIHERLEDLSPEWPVGGRPPAPRARFHAFQTATFLSAWLNSFGRSGRQSLQFIEVRDEASLPLIFIPLRILHRGGTRLLQFVDQDAADYNAPILFESHMIWSREVAEDLWRQIVEMLPPFDVVELIKMPAEVEGLINPLAYLGDRQSELSCHATDLRRSWNEIDREVPRRTTLLRKIRGLERVAPVGFHLAQTPDEVRKITDVMLRQKQRRFEETMVPGFDVDRDKHDFFREGTPLFHREEMLTLFYLTAGETIVATIWGLVADKRYYAIMLSFEGDEWTKHSPGSILFYKALKWLHDKGYEWMDLGIGNEPWKLESCRTMITLSERSEAVTGRGRFYLARLRANAQLRATKAYQKLRPLKWIVLRSLRGRRHMTPADVDTGASLVYERRRGGPPPQPT
ncbi:GNAT family N-acetyltransferase [Ensifer aridi]|uniref:GNAT family N-acetyltransferase n=2 Tax=Ensifer aridi TaxID=1708715 RepID=UPI001124FAD9|nr:GNAT family N-acetyltransferase [Ensifer aridi]